MDKTTETPISTSNNEENKIESGLLKKKTVHHDFTVKAMAIGSDFTVLEHKTIKQYQKNNKS